MNNQSESKLHEVTRPASRFGTATLLSRILGLIRDILSAGLFGTGAAWDAFAVGFTVPNLFRRLLGEGALASAFVPTFTEYAKEKGMDEAWRFTSAVAALLSLLLMGIVVCGITVLWILRRLLPLSERWDVFVELIMILLPYLFFICLVGLAMGILYSLRHFLMPALSPVVLNVVLIVFLIFLCPVLSDDAYTRIKLLALGVLIAGLLQLGLHAAVLVYKGMPVRFTVDVRHPGVTRVIKLMAPVLLGMSITQLNFLIDLFLALILGQGATSALYYSNRLIQFPLGIFAIAIATVLLPIMSEYAVEKRLDRITDTLSHSLRLICFIMVPASVGLIVLGKPIIGMLFERGAFTSVSTHETNFTLVFYALGMFAYAGIRSVLSTFYSLKDTVTPVRIGMVTLVVNVVLNLILMWPLRQGGLALSTSIAAILNLVLLVHALQKKVGPLDKAGMAKTFVRTLILSLLMGVLAWTLYGALSGISLGNEFFSRIMAVGTTIAVCVVFYLGTSAILKSPEWKEIRSALPLKKN